jgi:hypothetical protein
LNAAVKPPVSRAAALATVLVTALLCLGLCADSAFANSYRPRAGTTLHGVSDTGFVHDFNRYGKQVKAHPALLEDFFHWGVPLSTGALDRWQKTHTRGVLALSTAPGGEPEVITPRQISQGRGDHYLLRLNASIASSGQVVYLRPFGEMNLYLNPYSAFDSDGSRRPGHSTKVFRQAWRRMVIIVKGGKRNKVNAKLLHLNMPRIYRADSNKDTIYHRRGVPRFLEHPKVAFMWTPQTSGNPRIKANQARNYFPGRKYVDWVGADAYAKYANHTLWNRLRLFYKKWDKWPFVIGEYGPWDNDTSGAFTTRIFNWAAKRDRARALLYFRSNDPDNAFNLQFYPGARKALRRKLSRERYAPYAPGLRP